MTDPKLLAPELTQQVKEWDTLVPCLPTFEEVRQVEYLRKLGKHNMYTDNVFAALTSLGLCLGAAWIKRCQRAGLSWQNVWAKCDKSIENEHGHRDTWLTSDVRLTYARCGIAAKRRALREEMLALDAESGALEKNAEN